MPRAARRFAQHVVACTFAAASLAAHAQTWSGPGSDWNAGANWVGGAVPAKSTATNLFFDGTAATFTSNARVSRSSAASCRRHTPQRTSSW